VVHENSTFYPTSGFYSQLAANVILLVHFLGSCQSIFSVAVDTVFVGSSFVGSSFVGSSFVGSSFWEPAVEPELNQAITANSLRTSNAKAREIAVNA
jgi:hypothetical protein